MTDDADTLVTDPAEHLFRMFAANIDGQVTLSMCRAFVRLLAAALGPDAKADGAAEKEPSPEPSYKLRPPPAKPEATGAPEPPERVTLHEGHNGYWYRLGGVGLLSTGHAADYMPVALAEREAAELRRQVATQRANAEHIAHERDLAFEDLAAARARVAGLETEAISLRAERTSLAHRVKELEALGLHCATVAGHVIHGSAEAVIAMQRLEARVAALDGPPDPTPEEVYARSLAKMSTGQVAAVNTVDMTAIGGGRKATGGHT